MYKFLFNFANLYVLGVRDPYAIDVEDEDLVMVDGEAEAETAEEPKRTKSKSKRTVSQSLFLEGKSELSNIYC